MLPDNTGLALQRRMKRVTMASPALGGNDGGGEQSWALRQTMWRTATALGIKPSLKKRSATPCWVAMTSSVIGPTAKDERLAAKVWISSAMPVTALSDFATASRWASAHFAVAA